MAQKFSAFWTLLLKRITKIPYIDLGLTSGRALTRKTSPDQSVCGLKMPLLTILDQHFVVW